MEKTADPQEETMRVRVGVESGIEGHSLAWALDYPGCFAVGQDDSEAILRIPPALIAYAGRIEQHAARPWVTLGDFDIRLVETCKVYTIDENYERTGQGREVGAWFQHDWKPLAPVEIERGLQLMRWNREDLLSITGSLPEEQLDRDHPGEDRSVRGILNHVADAEWWYLDRLGLAGVERRKGSPQVFDYLQAVRMNLEETLPSLAGEERVTGREGEFWSPRKLLRRVLWHEMDHIGHILKLLTA
ncbi:MAG TPA: DinB family protein [Anaerolineaceae bacterium]